MTVRVLLVDDVVEIRGLVRTALRIRGGFEVVGEASNGAESVRLTAELRPDVVVLDLGLPDIAGQEVLSRIREHTPGARVVVFSGADPQSHSSIAEQVDGFVLKDDDIDYLVDLLVDVSQGGETEVSIELPRDLSSVREARLFATRTLTDWRLEALRDDVLVVVSELATNAITHGESPCRLSLSRPGSMLRIEVLDEGEGTPEPQPKSDSREHGRGLYMVDNLTSAWGMDVLPGQGKRVWAEMPQAASVS